VSVREEWTQAGALLIEGDTIRVRCRSTFSGTRWPDFARELAQAVSLGLLEGAAHVEIALPTVGELWTAGELLSVVASVPSPALRSLSLGSLLGAPELKRIEASWSEVQRAFPAIEHGANGCWQWAAKPRLRVVEVGPHFVTVRPNQVFTLEANGAGPWLSLRPPPAGGTEFDAVALQTSVSSGNVATMVVSPLEAGDEVRVNGAPVQIHPLSMHRNGQVLRKGTMEWLPVNGDTLAVLGLVVRYEEDLGSAPFASRQAHAVFMGGTTSSTITLDEPPPPDEEDD
jgi:hypothetical protein